MLPNIRIVPNISKALVIGLVFGILPWVVSKYLFPKTSRNISSSQNVNSTQDLPRAEKPALLQLPAVESAHRLQPASEQTSTVLTSGFPAETSSEPDIPDYGPVLNDPSPTVGYPSTETHAAQPAAELRYPTTNTPDGPRMPDEMPATAAPARAMPEQGCATVSSPAASTNHGSVPAEAAFFHPAVQKTTLPAEPERMPVEGELSHLSLEPSGSRPPQREALPVRSEQLESIARQADQEIRHGFELAGRGAYYAARSEFIAALRLVAQGLDTDRQTTIHGKSLAAGLTALREAEDFIPRGSMIEANLDIPAIVASHITPALKNSDNSQTTSLSALKIYLTYAQEQFAASADGEFSGSMALRALGKLHDELATSQNAAFVATGPKAVVFYQAALLVAPQNYMAANDLGVMLARSGNLKDAREILEHSAAISRQSTVLNNLATVYQRLGYNDLAAQTKQQSLLACQTEQARRQSSSISAANGAVQWLAPDTFAQTSPNLTAPATTASKSPNSRQSTAAIKSATQPTTATNTYGSNNPHWSPNYRQPAAAKITPNSPSQPEVMGQAQKNDYQR